MKHWAWLAIGLLAAQAGAQSCGEALGAGARRIDAAQFQVVYKLLPDPVPVGKHFAIDVRLCPKGNAALPAELRVDATMPEHKHGMNYRPTVSARGGGRYRVEGMLFHMSGRWEIAFELASDGPVQRIADSVMVE